MVVRSRADALREPIRSFSPVTSCSPLGDAFAGFITRPIGNPALASNKRLIGCSKSHHTPRRVVAQMRNRVERLLRAGPDRHVVEGEWAQDVGILRGVTGGDATLYRPSSATATTRGARARSRAMRCRPSAHPRRGSFACTA